MSFVVDVQMDAPTGGSDSAHLVRKGHQLLPIREKSLRGRTDEQLQQSFSVEPSSVNRFAGVVFGFSFILSGRLDLWDSLRRN